MSDPSITDWIGAASSVAATLIAAVTAYLAYKQYLQPPKQEADPDTPQDVTAAEPSPDTLVFRTSRQETRLTVSAAGLECHLLNKESGQEKHQWTLDPAMCTQILDSGNYTVNAGYKARSGTFSLGPRRNWLYSKALFPESDYLHGALTDLLKRASDA